MDTRNETSSILNTVRRRLPLIVFLLCVIQPFLDIAGYWQTDLGLSNTLTLTLRMLLLGGSVLLGFLLSTRKRAYFLTAAVLLLLTAGHVYACTRSANGYENMVTDLVNLVRIYFLPLMTLCFITFLRQNSKVLPAIVQAIAVNIAIIALVQLISALTGTDPHTYAVDKTGIRGWFMWTNSQSAILAMGCPVVICWALTHWKKQLLPIVLAAAVSEATLFVLAPRLAYASLAAAGLSMAICLLLLDRRRWRQALAVALVTCAFLCVYPLSPTCRRLSANEDRVERTEEEIRKLGIHIETEQVTEPASESLQPGQTEAPKPETPSKPVVKLDKENADKMEKLYRSHDILWSLVDRFGRERVFEAYAYSLDPTVISNTRTMKVMYCKLLMEESGTVSKLFGLNLQELIHQRYDRDGNVVYDNFDVENDLHGVYFLTGLAGLILMLLFLAFFGIRAVLAVLRKPKTYFTLPLCAFAVSYGLGLIHAYFTASVLRRNNASFYLALVLACLWYLSQRQSARESAQ